MVLQLDLGDLTMTVKSIHGRYLERGLYLVTTRDRVQTNGIILYPRPVHHPHRDLLPLHPLGSDLFVRVGVVIFMYSSLLTLDQVFEVNLEDVCPDFQDMVDGTLQKDLYQPLVDWCEEKGPEPYSLLFKDPRGFCKSLIRDGKAVRR